MHARQEEQDTDSKSVPAGLGVRSVVHFLPFHRNASVRKPLLPDGTQALKLLQAVPTAMQKRADVQVTEFS